MDNNVLNSNLKIDGCSYNEIFEKLKDDSIEEFVKIFLIVQLEKIETQEDMMIFINYLTNHPTPQREACAYKLRDLFNDSFINDFVKNKLLDAIVDINPNVSREICALIKSSKVLKEILEADIIARIEKLLLDIKNDNNYSNCNRNHAKNKKFFSLYWLLEALSCSISKRYLISIREILNFTITFYDYTIREKTAKILALTGDAFDDLLQIAKSDVNFYVKNQVYDKINFDD